MYSMENKELFDLSDIRDNNTFYQCGKCNDLFHTQKDCLNHDCWNENTADQAILAGDTSVQIQTSEDDLASSAGFLWNSESVSSLLKELELQHSANGLSAVQNEISATDNSSTAKQWSCTKKADIFHHIAEALQAKGFDVSGPTCHQKWQNLLHSYRTNSDCIFEFSDTVKRLSENIPESEEHSGRSDDEDNSPPSKIRRLSESDSFQNATSNTGTTETRKSNLLPASKEILRWDDKTTRVLLKLINCQLRKGNLHKGRAGKWKADVFNDIAQELRRHILSSEDTMQKPDLFTGKTCYAKWRNLQRDLRLHCSKTVASTMDEGLAPGAGKPFEYAAEVAGIMKKMERVSNGDITESCNDSDDDKDIRENISKVNSPSVTGLPKKENTANIDLIEQSESEFTTTEAESAATSGVACGFKWNKASIRLLLTQIQRHKDNGNFVKQGGRKRAVYNDIAESLRAKGYTHVDAHSCHQKWRNLVRDVKLANTARRQGIEKHCSFYNEVVNLMTEEELLRTLGEETQTENSAATQSPHGNVTPTAASSTDKGNHDEHGACQHNTECRKTNILQGIYDLLRQDIEEERHFRELVLLRYEERQASLQSLIEEIKKWS